MLRFQDEEFEELLHKKAYFSQSSYFPLFVEIALKLLYPLTELENCRRNHIEDLLFLKAT